MPVFGKTFGSDIGVLIAYNIDNKLRLKLQT